jgi:hypothetical protein
MAKAKHPPGPPMDLGNMRRLGVHHLIVCKCSARGRHIDVLPNWKEQPPRGRA